MAKPSNSAPAAGRSPWRVLAFVAFAALAAFLLTLSNGQADVPIADGSGDDPAAPPVSRATEPDAAQAPSERSAQGEATRAADEAARSLANTTFGTVEVRAILENEAGDVPLESFSWKAHGMAIGIEPRGVSEGRVARIRVPVDVDAAIVVDADGCKTSLAVDVALRGTQFRSVTVRMRPYYEKARITIRCKDDFGAPVQHVFVRCEHHPEASESRREWATLWTRHESSLSGVYEIDAQVAGWCRFHVAPLDAKGKARALLPEDFEARLADDRRIEKELTHRTGGTVSVAWNDREPMPKGVVSGRLRLYDETERERRVNWFAEDASPEEVGVPTLRYSVLPCSSGEAIPAGRYTLRIHGEDVDLQKPVEVRSGQNTHVVFP